MMIYHLLIKGEHHFTLRGPCNHVLYLHRLFRIRLRIVLLCIPTGFIPTYTPSFAMIHHYTISFP